MSRLAALMLAVAAASPALAADRFGVVAVADPPAGPDAELAELTHQLRAACRDRVGGVLDVPDMRARLLGQSSSATLPELERAYVGAEAALQGDELEIAASTLRAIVDDLEKLPESADAYLQWTRAMVRLAYVERLAKRPAVAAAVLDRLASIEPGFVLDEVQYPPSLRRELDDARRRVAGRRKAKLSVASGTRPVTVFVDGKAIGTTPIHVVLPPGRYRVGGASEGLRVPSASVQLDGEDRAVELDFALAEALRMNAGPGLALTAADRGGALVRAGAWLAATRVVAASVVSDRDAQFLNGALYDVQRGALLREARVRMAAGSVTSVQLGALAAFLLTGQPARGVEPVRSEPVALPAPGPSIAASAPPPNLTAATALGRAPAARPGWLRPAAYAAGAVGLGLAGVATWQGIAARNGYRDADAMLRPDDTLVPGATRATHDARLAAADGAKRNAYLSAAGTAVFAAAAGLLGYLSADDRGAPAVRF